jgi:hypothetical protein
MLNSAYALPPHLVTMDALRVLQAYFMELSLGAAYAAIIIYLVNYATDPERERVVRWMLYGVALLQATLGFTALAAVPDAPAVAAFLVLAIAVLGAATSALIIGHPPTRAALRRWLGHDAAYQPTALMHQTALVFMNFQVVSVVVGLFIAGGLAGLAQSIADRPAASQDVIFELGLNVLLALGGVGFFMRRSIPQTLARLGLGPLGWRQLVLALAVGVGLYMVVALGAALWQSSMDADTFAQQTAAANALFEAYAAAPGLGLALAAGAAVGEEVLYRGALQPVFGVVLTTVFFVLLHAQYWLTPAVLLIAVVTLVFALLRQRINTTAAIVAHFIYNAIPFVLLGWVGTA